MNLKTLLNQDSFSFEELVFLLSLEDDVDIDLLLKKAYEIKANYVGKKVYYRGLIEYSNICSKNCYYCGIRAENPNTNRYTMTDEEVLDCAAKAMEYEYGSIVLQGGERSDPAFVSKICELLSLIKEKTHGKLGVTLSLGEQSEETYKNFLKSGAHRYLLRIETSSPELYKKLHPQDHSFEERLESLRTLKRLGFQTGTGVMIGLPFQSIEDLARDLLFFKEFDIDMIGMGPYLEHEDTPLYQYASTLMPKQKRLKLTLKMIAILRIMMKDVNIASTTALQAIEDNGREQGLLAGANVIMPNLTPVKYRSNYQLYEDKPCMDEDADQCRFCLETRIRMVGDEIAYNEWGDPLHHTRRTKKNQK